MSTVPNIRDNKVVFIVFVVVVVVVAAAVT